MSLSETEFAQKDRAARARSRSVVIAVTTVVLAAVIAVVVAVAAHSAKYSVKFRGRAGSSTWQLETWARNCRRVRFTPPLAPLNGDETDSNASKCEDAPTMDDPLELLAIGQSGGRVVVAVNAAPEVKEINLGGGSRALRPSDGTVFVYVGARLPVSFDI